MPHEFLNETDYELWREGMDYWRLCDELNIFQAALLVVGVNPASHEGANCEEKDVGYRPVGYEAAKHAISKALCKGNIEGNLVPEFGYVDQYSTAVIPGSIDLKNSSVEVESLRAWLTSRGMKTGFFFPVNSDKPDYLDPQHSRYAPKLAAAVQAWLAVTDPGKSSPKKALDKWLREHAAQFGLSDDEGLPINQAIEECSKIANWQPGGGAPKTPG